LSVKEKSSARTTSLGDAANAALVSAKQATIARKSGVERLHVPDDAAWHAARAKDITASVAAALLGAHEWTTPFQLYAQKTGLAANDIEDTGPVRRGRLLEPVAVQVLREEHPDWGVRYNSGPDRFYYRETQSRIGCTPDIEAKDPQRGVGVVQVKSVEASIFSKKWRNEHGDIEPPLFIVIQAIIEATLTGAAWAAVAPIVVGHGVDMPLIDIPLHKGVMNQLRGAVADFWERVDAKRPYHPNYGKDGALIASLYPTDNGETIDLTTNNRIMELVAEREQLKVIEKQGSDAEKLRKALDAEAIHMLGEAARAKLPDGRLLEAKTIRRKEYTVKATSYRSVKILAA
jgi:hypothetical protein